MPNASTACLPRLLAAGLLSASLVLVAVDASAQSTAGAAKPAAAGCTTCAPDTLGRIRAAKRINVAFSGDSLPFSSVGPDGRPAGYSIDLCGHVVAQIGRATGVPDLKVNWLVGTAQDRVAMVASGKADLDCANTTATQARMRDVDFSSLVFVDAGGLLVRSDGKVRKAVDLLGKNIGVLGGTTSEAHLAAALKNRKIEARVVTLRDGNEGVAMLQAGSLDAFAGDKLKLAGLAAQARDPATVTLLEEDLSYEPLAFAVPRGDSAFRLEVNRALTQVYTSGAIDRIFDQWLGQFGRPSMLLAAVYLLNTIPE
jgi:glutamate/aspartate transport system substrate-binding protein